MFKNILRELRKDWEGRKEKGEGDWGVYRGNKGKGEGGRGKGKGDLTALMVRAVRSNL